MTKVQRLHFSVKDRWGVSERIENKDVGSVLKVRWNDKELFDA